MSHEAYPKALKDVTEDNNYEVKRLEVPGGFLVFVRDKSVTPNQFQLLFLPAPDSNWELK